VEEDRDRPSGVLEFDHPVAVRGCPYFPGHTDDCGDLAAELARPDKGLYRHAAAAPADHRTEPGVTLPEVVDVGVGPPYTHRAPLGSLDHLHGGGQGGKRRPSLSALNPGICRVETTQYLRGRPQGSDRSGWDPSLGDVAYNVGVHLHPGLEETMDDGRDVEHGPGILSSRRCLRVVNRALRTGNTSFECTSGVVKMHFDMSVSPVFFQFPGEGALQGARDAMSGDVSGGHLQSCLDQASAPPGNG